MILLGSTGSIGCNALKIAQKFHLEVETLVAGRNIALLNQQIAKFHPRYVVIADKSDAHKLQDSKAKVFFGTKGILQAIELSSSPLMLNALVGFIGLEPTLYAISLGKKIALANKESLVSGGWLIDSSSLIPVDSEHFSLWHLHTNRPFKRLIITASGGAFRDMPLESIPHQDAQNALKHPNWKMGQKITIDSASMANKLFELLEASWLFQTKNIQAYIERKSIIHGMIEFQDGSMAMHLAKPDMQLAISYALNPSLASRDSLISPLDFDDFCSLCLEKIDPKRYPLWDLQTILLENPKLGLVLNASNEISVEGFLQGQYNFGRMLDLIFESMQKFSSTPPLDNLEEIKRFDQEVRKFTQSLI